ncbi:proton-coupled amino acid transporter-like protein pathetic [Epargyreus clarus]|uniref:proton-coupled amino acid transporter-like protein pathetic n=1 Tax=Epargyreus clarus TaxID=520877 RepID=UPI003C2BB4C7
MSNTNEKEEKPKQEDDVPKTIPPKATPDRSKSTTGESQDDIASLCTLQMEVTEYLERTESTNYHEMYPGVEMIEYDYRAERRSLYATNILESIAHLIKGCLGAGIMGMHEAYMYGGLWASLASTILIGLLVFSSMFTLVNSAQTMYNRLRVGRLSYPDLAEVAVATGPMTACRPYSKVFRYLVELFLYIEFCGTCCIFQIMIAHTLKEVLEAISSRISDRDLSISLYVLIITVPLIILCLIRSLKYLAPFSLMADIFCAICVLTTMYYSISVAPDLSERPAWKSIHGWFRFCGVCLYTVDGIGVTLPIENNMRKPQYIIVVLQCGMAVVVALVGIIGFFGYWAWGETCRSPITIHMPMETAPIIMQFLLVASLAVTFAVHFWVPFRVIWHYIGKRYKRKRDIWERIYRTLNVLLITGLSIAFPNLHNWMSFLGNFFLGFIVFIFPAIIETLVMWKDKRGIEWRSLKDVCFIVIGILLCCGAIYSYDNE